MKLGFTGTRWGMTEQQLVVFEGLLDTSVTEFHHGSCQGADVEAALIIHKLYKNRSRVKIISHPGPFGDSCQKDSGVDDEVMSPQTHFARNRTIVDICDVLVACPYESEKQRKGGTWYTINYAIKIGKPLTIIWPNGGIEDIDMKEAVQ